MARYYCEYCHSYLTHDTLSVRKSHLIGKNHLRITADYYRNKKIELASKALRKQGSNKNKKHRHYRRGEDSKKSDDNSQAASTTKRPTIHCLTRREKKAQRRVTRQFHNELDSVEGKPQVLKILYKGSPGYNRVFIESNRFDVGDLIRAIRLPQRANAPGANHHRHQGSKREPNNNATANTTSGPNSNDNNTINWEDQPLASSFPLPPPPVLSQWSSTIPKTSIYNDRGQALTGQHWRASSTNTYR